MGTSNLRLVWASHDFLTFGSVVGILDSYTKSVFLIFVAPVLFDFHIKGLTHGIKYFPLVEKEVFSPFIKENILLNQESKLEFRITMSKSTKPSDCFTHLDTK